MKVSEAMTTGVVTIGPSHTLREASSVMTERNIGSVVVHDPEADGPGILTERDIVRAVSKGDDLDNSLAADYLTTDSAYGSPSWSWTRRPRRCAEVASGIWWSSKVATWSGSSPCVTSSRHGGTADRRLRL